jgi:hypothetical protein
MGSMWCVAAQGVRTPFASPNGEQRGGLGWTRPTCAGSSRWVPRGACDGADREVLARAGDGADREVLARAGEVRARSEGVDEACVGTRGSLDKAPRRTPCACDFGALVWHVHNWHDGAQGPRGGQIRVTGPERARGPCTHEARGPWSHEARGPRSHEARGPSGHAPRLADGMRARGSLGAAGPDEGPWVRDSMRWEHRATRFW